jgi:hypothetical protein
MGNLSKKKIDSCCTLLYFFANNIDLVDETRCGVNVKLEIWRTFPWKSILGVKASRRVSLGRVSRVFRLLGGVPSLFGLRLGVGF